RRAERPWGGGRVLTPPPPRPLDPERLELLENGTPAAIVAAIVDEPVTAGRLMRRGLLAPAALADGLASLEHAGDWYFSATWLERVRADVRERLAEQARASPLDPGLPLGELLPRRPWAPAVVPLLRFE